MAVLVFAIPMRVKPKLNQIPRWLKMQMRSLQVLICAVLLLPVISPIGLFGEDRPPKVILVIHGGAGVLTDQEMKEDGRQKEDYETELGCSLKAGYLLLKNGKSSVEAVEASIRVLEDSKLFNAGRGAVFNQDGRVELDASIMEGRVTGQGEGKKDPRKRAGAVAGVTHIKNPISAARAVMEMKDHRHLLLVGEGAEAFALNDENRKRYGLVRVSNLYFWTDRQVRQIREEFEKEAAAARQEKVSVAPVTGSRRGGADRRFGTVGAVALDQKENLAAGTSTGGLTNKLPGRLGDSPIIGAGTYADDRACGVSCTGTGEVFIRHAVAHDIVAKMLYGKSDVVNAVTRTLNDLPDEDGGVGGVIALDPKGRHAFGMSPKCDGMYRGYATEDGKFYVAVLAQDAVRQITISDDAKCSP